jgi:type IV pilus assembly protein PilE
MRQHDPDARGTTRATPPRPRRGVGRDGRVGRRVQQGFTLVELMTVGAVIAILAGVAYPMYTSQLVKAQRAEAKAALMRSAQMLERSFTQNGGYPTAANFATLYGLAAGTAIYSNVDQPAVATRAKYILTYTPGAAPGPGLPALSYTLAAVPYGGANPDAACANFQLNERGQRTVTGTTAADICWK